MTKEELINKIKEASEAYHNGNEIMSDDEYDALTQELKKLDPTNILANSDIDEGEDAFNLFPKRKHNLITGTLKKCHNESEMRKEWTNEFHSVQLKIDGAGIELVYKNGELVDAITRGDGYTGFSIVENFKKLLDKYNIKIDIDCSIRGEYLMFNDTFEKKYKSLAKNARNMASGIAKRLDGSGMEDLDFIAYEIKTSDNRFTREA